MRGLFDRIDAVIVTCCTAVIRFSLGIGTALVYVQAVNATHVVQERHPPFYAETVKDVPGISC